MMKGKNGLESDESPFLSPKIMLIAKIYGFSNESREGEHELMFCDWLMRSHLGDFVPRQWFMGRLDKADLFLEL